MTMMGRRIAALLLALAMPAASLPGLGAADALAADSPVGEALEAISRAAEKRKSAPAAIEVRKTSEGNVVREEPGPGRPEISATWPDVGGPADEAIRAEVVEMIASFKRTLDEDLGDASPEDQDEIARYSMKITCEVSRPSPACVSVIFDVWTYTGGAHGMLGVVPLTYDTATGKEIPPAALFDSPSTAILLMSAFSRLQLMARAADPDEEKRLNSPEDMIISGTEASEDSFAALSLIPGGIRIHFQPYQVAPWSEGAPAVDMSLEDLAPARPVLRFWGK